MVRALGEDLVTGVGHATRELEVRRVRAGRDLPAAIIVGIALALIIIVPLFTVRPLWIAVICAAVTVGVFEMVRALRLCGIKIALPPLAVGTAAMPAVAYLTGTSGLVLALAATAVVTTAWRLAYSDKNLLTDVAASVFCAAYVGLPAGFAALLTSPPDGPRRMVAFLATAAASDIGGYTAGVLSGGRHKLAPTVSPGKSWEGFAGSVVVCVIVASVSMAWPLHAALWQGAVLGIAIACTATAGDLGESLLKRDIGIKDMGNLLPGHGGIMDRLDSVLCTAPVAWLLITAFAPPS
ncbi:phosphatidate cytidylyltransferase [Frankia sp. Cas3]|uniref:phosphatidate cytidylyltransferase n=1 Tax=Frankia sp. Cas3 TaxID=3073926 RepID=UPI002AD37EF8|nr:phosphatidate cytidylyltransferase [Frankia sp. Cas3]